MASAAALPAPGEYRAPGTTDAAGLRTAAAAAATVAFAMEGRPPPTTAPLRRVVGVLYPAGAGALPPAGYFYNAHGELHQLPAHAATAARSTASLLAMMPACLCPVATICAPVSVAMSMIRSITGWMLLWAN